MRTHLRIYHALACAARIRVLRLGEWPGACARISRFYSHICAALRAVLRAACTALGLQPRMLIVMRATARERGSRCRRGSSGIRAVVVQHGVVECDAVGADALELEVAGIT